ncbi:MAG: AraC family transcriptional regulator [Alistipes sp.]|nr:AraC family transcriptional regulator [Alistipes sp.]
MRDPQQYIEIDTIAKCNAYFGIETKHPLVSIVDLSTVSDIDIDQAQLHLYAVVCASLDGNISGHVRFYAPGHKIGSYNYNSLDIDGWILIFHPDLLEDTLLARRMSEYAFFDCKNSTTLHIDKHEIRTINNCMLSLREELQNDTDRYTQRILVSGIAVLLSICMRYAEHHTSPIMTSNKNVVARLNTLLNFRISHSMTNSELPSVAECARALGISANYLGDLVRKQAGCTAKEYIQNYIVNEAKIQLSRSSRTINQIALDLGFKYAHHLTRLFKRITGMTPNQYRMREKSV